MTDLEGLVSGESNASAFNRIKMIRADQPLDCPYEECRLVYNLTNRMIGMVDSFEEIRFLTGSENRVEILETLSTDQHTELTLVEVLDMSETTIERTLDAFEKRGWIRMNDEHYEITRLGEVIAEDYNRLAASMDLASRLGPALDVLPIEEMGFDLRHLTEARITHPETFDPLETLDSRADRVREADRIIGLAPSNYAVELVIKPFYEAVVDRGLELRTVVTADYVETVRSQPELRQMLREQLQAGAEVYVAPEHVDITTAIALYDDLATITGLDETGTPRISIESRAEPVQEWVREMVAHHRSKGALLTPDDLAD